MNFRLDDDVDKRDPSRNGPKPNYKNNKVMDIVIYSIV